MFRASGGIRVHFVNSHAAYGKTLGALPPSPWTAYRFARKPKVRGYLKEIGSI